MKLRGEERAFQVVLVVKNPPANAWDERDSCSIPRLGRFPGEGIATHSSMLAWRIPWTEEPGRLHSKGSQRVGLSWSNLARTQAGKKKKKNWSKNSQLNWDLNPGLLTLQICLHLFTNGVYCFGLVNRYTSYWRGMWLLTWRIHHQLL